MSVAGPLIALRPKSGQPTHHFCLDCNVMGDYYRVRLVPRRRHGDSKYMKNVTILFALTTSAIFTAIACGDSDDNTGGGKGGSSGASGDAGSAGTPATGGSGGTP